MAVSCRDLFSCPNYMASFLSCYASTPAPGITPTSCSFALTLTSFSVVSPPRVSLYCRNCWSGTRCTLNVSGITSESPALTVSDVSCARSNLLKEESTYAARITGSDVRSLATKVSRSMGPFSFFEEPPPTTFPHLRMPVCAAVSTSALIALFIDCFTS